MEVNSHMYSRISKILIISIIPKSVMHLLPISKITLISFMRFAKYLCFRVHFIGIKPIMERLGYFQQISQVHCAMVTQSV